MANMVRVRALRSFSSTAIGNMQADDNAMCESGYAKHLEDDGLVEIVQTPKKKSKAKAEKTATE
ncbi:hypothetical protein [uncultured Paraglaciecola sp.]|uniref:hypothetical protein n=1 Tax=uncultured Paraglaciecola sp. TaxID=1765024 RepID=UPI002624B44D|nr:hypothetical protein [uncultured Paraglaciecola sp.]